MTIILDNPIFLLFLSFAIGAAIHGLLSNREWYQQYYDLNFISDQTTKRIGVLWIEWLILKTPLKMFNPQLKIEGRPTKDKLIKLRAVMTAAELNHIIGFVLIIPFIIYYIIAGKSALLIISLKLLNLCFNGYTALTQQYNKRRLEKVIKRMKL